MKYVLYSAKHSIRDLRIALLALVAAIALISGTSDKPTEAKSGEFKVGAEVFVDSEPEWKAPLFLTRSAITQYMSVIREYGSADIQKLEQIPSAIREHKSAEAEELERIRSLLWLAPADKVRILKCAEEKTNLVKVRVLQCGSGPSAHKVGWMFQDYLSRCAPPVEPMCGGCDGDLDRISQLHKEISELFKRDKLEEAEPKYNELLKIRRHKFVNDPTLPKWENAYEALLQEISKRAKKKSKRTNR